MKRILVAAVPLLAAALLIGGPASATTAKKKVTCHQIRTELQAGKTPSDVAKELKISKKDVDRCSAKVASNKKHVHGTSSGSPAAPPAQ